MTVISSSPETAQLDQLPQSVHADEVPRQKEIELLQEFPVTNTFIQFSAPRSTSLEKFLAKREAQSCPASRMVSIDEAQQVKEWPATRGPSLEEELNEKPSLPSRMVSVDEEPTHWPATRGPSLEEESKYQASTIFHLEKDRMEFPISWGESFAQMQCSGQCSAVVASVDVDVMAWDPSQWQLDPTPLAGQENAHGVSDEGEFLVKPVSKLTPWPVNWEPFLSSNGQPDFTFAAEQVAAQGNPQGGQFAACPTSQNLAEWDAMNALSTDRDPLLELFMMRKDSARNNTSACDASASTAASSVNGDVVRELLIPKGMFDDTAHDSESDFSPSRTQPCIFDDEACSPCAPDNYCDQVDKDMSGSLPINLTYGLGLWSIGSAKHATGDCKPCGFLWKKGCHKAQNCQFCHLCPADEVKKRKQAKIAARKFEEEMLWQCQADDEQVSHCEPRVLPPLPK